MKNQKDLFDQFKFNCFVLKDCVNVIQNPFINGLTEDEARQLIDEFDKEFKHCLSSLKDDVLRIKEFIWSCINE